MDKKVYFGLGLIPFIPVMIVGFIAGMLCVSLYCGWLWADKYMEQAV